MQELEATNYHRLNASVGWLELGNPGEAELEWAKIPETCCEHPDVLEVFWRIKAAKNDWNAALEIARRLIRVAPDNPAGWIDQSYSLHETKRTQEAWDQLLPIADKFPKIGIIPYNLACYACQLGDPAGAHKFLAIAIDLKGKEEVKRLALGDRDLEPLREFVHNL